jgi:hypothetical protein
MIPYIGMYLLKTKKSYDIVFLNIPIFFLHEKNSFKSNSLAHMITVNSYFVLFCIIGKDFFRYKFRASGNITLRKEMRTDPFQKLP